jgi:hypothetical protein
LKLVKTEELYKWADRSLNDEDYKLVAAVALELLHRDIDDLQAHQALM